MSHDDKQNERMDDSFGRKSTSDSFDDSEQRRGRGSDDISRSSDDSITEGGGRGRGRGRGRRRGRGRHRDDDFSSNSRSDDPITGERVRRGYTFKTDDDGNVTSLKRIKRGRTKREKIEAGETWNYDPENMYLIHREFEAGRVEITTYTDPDQDSIFTRAFKTYEASAAFVVDMF